MKKKTKNTASRIWWFIISFFLVAIFSVVNVLSTTIFYELLNTVMPGGGVRSVFDPTIEPVYKSQYKSKEEALKAANALNEELCAEGMVLLKNENGALPIATPESDHSVSKKPRISIFGKNSVNIAYGGSGSGAGDTKNAVDLYSALTSAGYEINPTLKAFYENESASGPKRQANSSDLDSGKSISIATAETPETKYTESVKSSYDDYKDAAIVVLTRIGGEGFDLPRSMKGVEGANSEDDTYLQLDKNERDLLTSVCNAGFKKVVVVINSGATMELTFLKDKSYFADADKIDAAVWMGYPGLTGTASLAKILNGKVNPSGKTVDTYASDLKKNPTYMNFGDNNIENGDRYVSGGKNCDFYFVDHEESVYVGYKYYETRAVSYNGAVKSIGEKDYSDGEEWYADNVVYPFGYGLSYTDFNWSLADVTSLKDVVISPNGDYVVKVRVENSGSCAGKDIVEVYAHAPYFEGEIEKPEKVLVGFAKTKLLQPGEDEVVEVKFDPYYLASYDYNDANKNGKKAYELDAGDYSLIIGKNAHDVQFKVPFKVSTDIIYEEDPVTENPVINRYSDQEEYFNSDEHLGSILSRTAWNSTWPASPTIEDRMVDSAFLSALRDVTTNNPNDLDNEEMPWFDEPAGMKLRDMMYDKDGHLLEVKDDGSPIVAYDDERWQTLLEQCSANELIHMINYGAFHSAALDSIKKARTNDTDGPVGFVNFMDPTTFYGTCSYCCEVVIASTWNEQLVEEFGKSVGEEGIWGDAENRSNGMPYSGWYAPGVNIHRSPFGGRNFEYFSEDGILAGKMAAAQIRGCQSKGVYCFVKHFALNEQETHRAIGGNCSWVTEQAMREIFLKPFELAVKEGGTRAVMSSFNRIGTRWTGGDYRLLTEILRNEWGFKGTVICDFNTTAAYMNSRQMAYAGGDLNLSTTPVSWCDESDTADTVVLMQCAKNILYTVVNSNAMNKEVLGYRLPLWTICLIAVDCLVVIGIVASGCATFKKKKKIQTSFE